MEGAITSLSRKGVEKLGKFVNYESKKIKDGEKCSR